MAGDDFLIDAKIIVAEFIEKEIRSLLSRPTNQFQNPNWDQSMRLFLRIVVACDDAFASYEGLHQLGKDILQKAKDNNNRVYYFGRDENHIDMFAMTPYDYELSHNAKIEFNIQVLKKWLEKYRQYY